MTRCAQTMRVRALLVFSLVGPPACTALNPAYVEGTTGSTTKDGPEPATGDPSGTPMTGTTAKDPTATDPPTSNPTVTDPAETGSSTVDPSTVGSAETIGVTTDGEVCADDAHEEDDGPEQATSQGAVPPGVYDGVLCPDDPDWLLVELVQPGVIRADVLASEAGAEVALFDDAIDSLDTNRGPDGFVSECLPAGDYFVELAASVNDTAVTYGLALSVEPCVSEACCESIGRCPDPVIAACVCMGDPFCCETTWDAVCIEAAVGECGLVCD